MLNGEGYSSLISQYTALEEGVQPPDSPKESRLLLKSEKQNNPFIIKVVSNALNYVAQAISTTGTTVIIARMLHGLAGAADLANLWQSVARNAVGGGMVATAQYFTKDIGNKSLLLSNDLTSEERVARETTIERAREIIAVSYVLTALLTVMSMTAFGLSYFILPSVADAETADATFLYLVLSGLGTWPTLALNTIGQTAYVRGYYKSPVISSFGNRIPAVLLSYLFVKYTAQLNNIKGVGLGNALGSWLSYLAMEIWMRHQSEFSFMEMKKLPFSKTLLKKDLPPMFKLWAMMALQRFSEWGNLWAVGTLIGALSSDDLKKTNASTTIIGILGLIYQGIGTAGNLTLTTEIKILESTDIDIDTKKIAFQKIKSDVFKFLLASLVASISLGAFIFSLKEYIVQVLADDKSQGFESISQEILSITLLALVGDSVRITSSNLLNAWYNKNDYKADRLLGSGFYKILLPNIVSIMTMTAIGIPAGYFTGYLSGNEENNNNMLICIFSARAVTVFIASIINTLQLYHAIAVDHKKLFPNEDVNETYSARFFTAVKNKW